MAGAKGDTGAAGAKGDPGVAGAKGDTGAAGAKGDKGDTGAKGDMGAMGAKGDKGDVGTKGDKGDTGAMGPPGVMYVRTKVVSPEATDLQSGAVLRAAIGAIGDGKTWRVKLEPGVYDLGSSPLSLKAGISLEGSGENITIVRSNTSTEATLVGVSGSQVSDLTVENTGGGSSAIALYSEGASFTFHDVTATARNAATVYAIFLKGVRGNFERVHAFASGTSEINAFRCGNCVARLSESTAEAQGGINGLGIYIFFGTVTLRNVNASSTGATKNWGIYADGDVSLVNVEALGNGGSSAIGLLVGEGNGTVRNSVLTGRNATGLNEGLDASADHVSYPKTSIVILQNSVAKGSSSSVYRGDHTDFRIGHSQLDGPVTQTTAPADGTIYTCLGAYNLSFVPIACP